MKIKIHSFICFTISLIISFGYFDLVNGEEIYSPNATFIPNSTDIPKNTFETDKE